jgi:hypothetical protein
MRKFVSVVLVTLLYCFVEFVVGVSIPPEFYLALPYVASDNHSKKSRD